MSLPPNPTVSTPLLLSNAHHVQDECTPQVVTVEYVPSSAAVQTKKRRRLCAAALILVACIAGLAGAALYFRPSWLPFWPPVHPVSSSAYLGQPCDALGGAGCNPYQVPGSDKSWVPGLAVASGSALRTELRHMHQSYEGSFAEDYSSLSNSVADSFGIDATAFKGVFSASGSLKNVFSSSMEQDVQEYYFRNHIQYDVYALSVDTPTATAELLAVVSGLPKDSNADLTAYFDFFSQYGTHFTQKIVFGGKLQLEGRVTSTIMTSNDTEWNQATLQACATTLLAQQLGLKGQWVVEKDQQRMSRFAQYASSGSVDVIGGVPQANMSDLDTWTASVVGNEVPVQTMLAPITALLPPDHLSAATEALQQYLTRCNPKGSDNDEPCNGVGWCDWRAQKCSCPGTRTGQFCELFTCRTPQNTLKCKNGGKCDNTTGHCVCPTCSNGGTCDTDTGSCKCPRGTVSYMGNSCETPCGTWQPYVASSPSAPFNDGSRRYVDVGTELESNCNGNNADAACHLMFTTDFRFNDQPNYPPGIIHSTALGSHYDPNSNEDAFCASSCEPVSTPTDHQLATTSSWRCNTNDHGTFINTIVYDSLTCSVEYTPCQDQ